jgi:hypothetical protein
LLLVDEVSTLSRNLLTTQTMVTTGILPQKENPHGRARNRTRDLVISNQKLWPPDHEAGQNYIWTQNWFSTVTLGDVYKDNADYDDNAGSRVFCLRV